MDVLPLALTKGLRKAVSGDPVFEGGRKVSGIPSDIITEALGAKKRCYPGAESMAAAMKKTEVGYTISFKRSRERCPGCVKFRDIHSTDEKHRLLPFVLYIMSC